MYVLQFGKSTTLSNALLAATTGAVAGAFSSAVFSTFATTDYLVVDYDVPAKREVISGTYNSGTNAWTIVARGLEGTSGVDHAAGAKVCYALVPSHYANGLGAIAAADAWTAYTPTFTGVTVGNATVTGAYIQLGKTVIYKGKMVAGNTTNFTSVITASLPVTAKTANSDLGTGLILDQSGGWYYTVIALNTSTTVLSFFVTVNSNGAGALGTVGSTQVVAVNYPIGWGVTGAGNSTSDVIEWTITYEAA